MSLVAGWVTTYIFHHVRRNGETVRLRALAFKRRGAPGGTCKMEWRLRLLDLVPCGEVQGFIDPRLWFPCEADTLSFLLLFMWMRNTHHSETKSWFYWFHVNHEEGHHKYKTISYAPLSYSRFRHILFLAVTEKKLFQYNTIIKVLWLCIYLNQSILKF